MLFEKLADFFSGHLVENDIAPLPYRGQWQSYTLSLTFSMTSAIASVYGTSPRYQASDR